MPAAFLLAASLRLTFSANAQQLTPVSSQSDQVTVDTDCRTYKPGVLMADIECEIRKGKALDAQNKSLDNVNACLDKLIAFKKASPQEFKKLGRITDENACALSGRIGKPTASAAPVAGG